MDKRTKLINDFNKLADIAVSKVTGPEATAVAGIWTQRLKSLFQRKGGEYEVGLFVEIAEYGVVTAIKNTALHRSATALYLEYSEILADRNEHHLSGCLETIWEQDPIEPKR